MARVLRPGGRMVAYEPDWGTTTLEWVDWFNHRRLLEPIGQIPPAEFEAMYYARQGSLATEVGLN